MPKIPKKVWEWLAPTIGAVTNATAWDSAVNGGGTPFFSGDWDVYRGLNTAANAGIGAIIGHNLRGKNYIDAATAVGTNIFKDLGMAGIKWMHDDTDIKQQKLQELLSPKKAPSNNTLAWVLGGLGIGALGLGGYSLYKWLQKKDEESQKQEKTHIKIRVKGKDGDPNKTMDVVMPVDSPEFSDKLMEGLNLSLRRNAKEVIRANSMKRDPETGKMIDYETWDAKYGKGRRTDATGTPIMNTPSSNAYASGPVFKSAAFWKKAAEVALAEENPAQVPGSMMPTILRKVTGPSIVEYMLPGAANNALTPELLAAIMANGTYTVPAAVQNAQSYAATGSSVPPSFEDDDDDFDKMAGQAPPPDGGGGGGGGGGGAPKGATMPPEVNMPAQGVPEGGSATAVSAASQTLAGILDRLKKNRNADSGITQKTRPQPQQTPH